MPHTLTQIRAESRECISLPSFRCTLRRGSGSLGPGEGAIALPMPVPTTGSPSRPPVGLYLSTLDHVPPNLHRRAGRPGHPIHQRQINVACFSSLLWLLFLLTVTHIHTSLIFPLSPLFNEESLASPRDPGLPMISERAQVVPDLQALMLGACLTGGWLKAPNGMLVGNSQCSALGSPVSPWEAEGVSLVWNESIQGSPEGNKCCVVLPNLRVGSRTSTFSFLPAITTSSHLGAKGAYTMRLLTLGY